MHVTCYERVPYDTSQHLELETLPQTLDFLKIFLHICAGKWKNVIPFLSFKMTDSENPKKMIKILLQKEGGRNDVS